MTEFYEPAFPNWEEKCMTKQPSIPVDLLIEGGIVITMDAERRIYDQATWASRMARLWV